MCQKGTDMSEDELRGLPALQGYINWEEAKRILLNGVGQTSLLGLFAVVVTSLGESAHIWYTGPNAPIVIFVATSLAAYFRSKMMAKRFIAEGEPY